MKRRLVGQAARLSFIHKNVTSEQILRPHLEATKRRMREHPVVLILQDTTELDLTAHPPEMEVGLAGHDEKRTADWHRRRYPNSCPCWPGSAATTIAALNPHPVHKQSGRESAE
jgi:hypothetical protein